MNIIKRIYLKNISWYKEIYLIDIIKRILLKSLFKNISLKDFVKWFCY
mgnify:CR=1 FL=1